MRILLVTHGLPPESVGGVEQHVSGLADALADAGHEVEIFARSSGDGEAGSRCASTTTAGIPVTRARYRWEGLRTVRDLYVCEVMERSLADFLAERAPFDVAHVHHLTGLSTGALRVLTDSGVPTVLTLHDYWLMCPRGQMFHREERPCERVEVTRCTDCLVPTFGGLLGDAPGAEVAWIHENARATLASATGLCTPSARTLPFFERLGIDRARITVVENAVDTDSLATVSPPRSDGPLRIGYLGTLIPSKGLDVLVRAFAALPQGTATLTIHGNAVPYHGDEGFLTRCFQHLEPGMAASYHGPYTTADLPRLLAEIDVLAAPARWEEAFGLTVREAQAAGRPVVVSRIGGLQDAVEDGVEGLQVPPGDVAALTGALARLAADRALVGRMGAAARHRTRGFQAMAQDLLAVYRRAAKLDPGAPSA